METSAFISFLFGVYVLTISIRMLLNPIALKKTMDDFIDDGPLVFLTGILALMGGGAIVWFHNIWELSWRGFITFFGWAAMIEGVLMIIAPKSLIHLARKMLVSDRFVQALGAIYLPLGIYLIYKAKPFFGASLI